MSITASSLWKRRLFLKFSLSVNRANPNMPFLSFIFSKYSPFRKMISKTMSDQFVTYVWVPCLICFKTRTSSCIGAHSILWAKTLFTVPSFLVRQCDSECPRVRRAYCALLPRNPFQNTPKFHSRRLCHSCSPSTVFQKHSPCAQTLLQDCKDLVDWTLVVNFLMPKFMD